MSIEIEVFGNEQISKHKSNIVSYSYSEESTPIAPGDSSGGVGSLSFTSLEYPDITRLIYNDEVYLRDSFHGSVSGKVSSVSADEGLATFNGTSGLARLNITKTVPAMESTLGVIIEEIFSQAGILSGVNIADTIYFVPAFCPGYTGDLWVFLKDLCTAYEVEVTLVDDVITVRELRKNTVQTFDLISEGWDIASISPAQFVEVKYYNYHYEPEFLAYPKGGWTPDTQVYQVDANQELVVDLPVNAYMYGIVQPVIMDTVGRYESSTSVYCVAGKDGLPVLAAQWQAGGGNLVAELINNGTSIRVTITGANIPSLAPFRIGVSAGPSDYYSSLRILGEGISYDEKVHRQATGLTSDDTSNEVGLTVSNKFINTVNDAHDAAMRAIINYAVPRQTYRFAAPALGDFVVVPGEIVYANFGEYDASLDYQEVFSGVDADIDNWDFQMFDAHLPSVEIGNTVITQMFGNINGARIKHEDSWYRIRSATITQDSIDASSEWDNLVSDFNTANVDETFATFNGTFENLTFNDFTLIPMRTG